MGELTDREREILDLENETWQRAAHKEEAIAVRLNQSPTAYYQMLAALLDREEAFAYRAALVYRLRRIRDARR